MDTELLQLQKLIPIPYRRALGDDLKSFLLNIYISQLRDLKRTGERLISISTEDNFWVYVSSAFTWRNTEQGHEYWNNVSCKEVEEDGGQVVTYSNTNENGDIYYKVAIYSEETPEKMVIKVLKNHNHGADLEAMGEDPIGYLLDVLAESNGKGCDNIISIIDLVSRKVLYLS